MLFCSTEVTTCKNSLPFTWCSLFGGVFIHPAGRVDTILEEEGAPKALALNLSMAAENFLRKCVSFMLNLLRELVSALDVSLKH